MKPQEIVFADLPQGWHPSRALPLGWTAPAIHACAGVKKPWRKLGKSWYSLEHRATGVAQEIDENIAHACAPLNDPIIKDLFGGATSFSVKKGTVTVRTVREFDDDDAPYPARGPAFTFPIRWLELETAAWMAEYEADHNLLKVEPGENL